MLNFCHRENRMVATITTGKMLEMMGKRLILIFLSRMGTLASKLSILRVEALLLRLVTLEMKQNRGKKMD